jgi:capsular polysaccharide biosynthesis protein
MSETNDVTGPAGARTAAGPPPIALRRPVTGRFWANRDALDAVPDDPDVRIRALAALVSFHYLRAAVRRRWVFCALTTALGAMLGFLYIASNPEPPTATTTLMLTHPSGVDSADAFATDLSLLSSRVVAERTIEALGLSVSPQSLMGAVTPAPTASSEVLQLTMTGPTPAEAVRRIERFSKDYLDFRAGQLSARSDALIKGYQDRIAALQLRVRDLDARIQSLAAGGDTATDRLSDVVTQRSGFNGQIARLQDQVQDTTLEENTIAASSRVIDPAAGAAPGGIRRAGLTVATGVIAGAALGLGLVVLQAILSNRLRLRSEVSSALRTEVPLSVRRLAPLPSVVGLATAIPWVRAVDARRGADRDHLARVVAKAVTGPGSAQSIAVLCLGDSREARFGLLAAATALGTAGRPTTIVDLTQAGDVAAGIGRIGLRGAGDEPRVVRPGVVPIMANGPSQIEMSEGDDAAAAAERPGDIVLIVADLDPAVGVDHLRRWTDKVIVTVTAGRSSADLVRTAGDLVRAAGLHLCGAVLLRAMRGDVTSGRTPPVIDGHVDLNLVGASPGEGIGIG